MKGQRREEERDGTLIFKETQKHVDILAQNVELPEKANKWQFYKPSKSRNRGREADRHADMRNDRRKGDKTGVREERKRI